MKVKKIWRDPVWSTVIAAGILAAITWLGTLAHTYWWPIVSPYASKILRYLHVPYHWSSWLFIICLMAIVLCTIYYVINWEVKRKEQKKKIDQLIHKYSSSEVFRTVYIMSESPEIYLRQHGHKQHIQRLIRDMREDGIVEAQEKNAEAKLNQLGKQVAKGVVKQLNSSSDNQSSVL